MYFVLLYIISSVSSYCVTLLYLQEVKDNNDIMMAADIKNFIKPILLRILYSSIFNGSYTLLNSLKENFRFAFCVPRS